MGELRSAQLLAARAVPSAGKLPKVRIAWIATRLDAQLFGEVARLSVWLLGVQGGAVAGGGGRGGRVAVPLKYVFFFDRVSSF